MNNWVRWIGTDWKIIYQYIYESIVHYDWYWWIWVNLSFCSSDDVSLLVHGVNLWFIVLFGLKSDQFHGIGKDSFVQKLFGFEVNVLSHFKTMQTLLLAMTVKFFQHTLPETFVNNDLLVASIESILLGKFHQIVLEGSCYQDSVIFGWVSVEENLTSIQKFMRIGCIDMLNFLRSNIFSLLQFEYVFLPVDNLEGIELWHDLNHIAWFQPSIFGNGLSSFFRLFVVAKEDMRASYPALSSRGWDTIDNIICCVLHLGDIAGFDFNCWC